MSQYTIIQPRGGKTSYNSTEQINFEITYLGMEIVPNSFYLSGELNVQSVALGSGEVGNIDNNLEVKYDGKIGVHGFINSMSVESQKLGLLENITGNYGRWARMLCDVQLNNNDLFMSNYVQELRTANDKLSTQILRGTGNDDYNKNPDFFLHLKNCINMTSGAPITFDKFGILRLTINLNSVRKALYGRDVGADTTFSLDNVKLHYKIRPQGQYNVPTRMLSVSVIPQEIESSAANVIVDNPVLSDAVSISFQKTSHSNQYQFNEHETETPPFPQRAEMNFNDQTNSYLTFPLDNLEEMVLNYRKSMGMTSHSEVIPSNYQMGKNFGLGLKFPQTINFLNQSFAVYFQSSIDNDNKFNIFVYYHTMLEY